MRRINTSFSHLNIEKKIDKIKNSDWPKHTLLDDILKSNPRKINTYDELVKDVAQIMYYNRNLTLFFRGQSKDYKDDDRTIIKPSIYRKKHDEKRVMLKDRFEHLKLKSEELKKLFKESEVKYAGRDLINKYPEIAWSLLQHYEVCDTPLLDITHSLHVACSFAFDRNKSNTGIIYVLGMPWQSDPLGYNSYEELLNIKLLSVSPPQANRPYFQEGYLAGPFPNYQLDNSVRATQFDFARRLIAKFEIPITVDFWGNGFNRIPKEKLYQPVDPIKNLCDKLK